MKICGEFFDFFEKSRGKYKKVQKKLIYADKWLFTQASYMSAAV